MLLKSLRTRPLIAAALAVLVFFAAAPTLAKKKKKGKGKSSTEVGKYTDWKGDIDVLEIVETFQTSSYKKIVVNAFDTSETPLPEAEDNTYEPVKTVLADPVTSFAKALREESGLVVTPGEEGGDGALVIRGVVDEMDPGSRAARYWGGFGAGAARTKLSLEIVDGSSGKTLLKMTQERRSGVGMAGGDYVKLMNRNLRAIGEDVAMVLDAF